MKRLWIIIAVMMLIGRPGAGPAAQAEERLISFRDLPGKLSLGTGPAVQAEESLISFAEERMISFKDLPGKLSPGDGPSVQAEERARPITAWPLAFHRSEKDRAKTDLLWPLFHYERERAKTRYSLRPFLFSTEHDPEKDSRRISLIWPMTGYTRRGPELSLYIFPLYWYGKSPDKRHNILFPVYWDGEGQDYSYFHLWPLFGLNHRGSSDTEYSTIYPLFRYRHDPRAEKLDIHAPWPIVNFSHHGDDYSSHRFLPWYWYEKGRDYRGGFIFPWYWRNTPTCSAKGVFPLWYSSRGPKLKTDLFFPLYFNREAPEEHIRLVTPLYIDAQREESHLSTLIPLYLDYGTGEKDFRFIAPSYVRRRGERSRLSTFVPLYLDYWREDMGIRIVLPDYFRYQSGTFSFSSFFPIYYHSKDTQKQSEFSYYFPLYGTYRRGAAVSHHFLLFPLYSHLEDEGLQLKAWDAVWPFFHYERSPSTHSFRLLPFYWHTQAADYRFTLGSPFYWSFQRAEKTYTHLIPFYGVHTQGDWYKKRFVLGPLFMDTRDSRQGLSKQDILFPIYSRRKEPEKGRSWLMPFYYHRHEAGERLTLGSLALLPPYYFHRKEDESEFHHLWPFFGKHDRGSYREYSTLWPFFRIGSDSRENRQLVHFLLYYHRVEKEKALTTVLPFWLHNETPRATHDVSPLLHWYAHDQKRERKDLALLWLFPPEVSLMKYQRQPESLRHALFPLYSYARDQGKDTLRLTFLWPLFSYRSRGEWHQQTGFLWKVISYERWKDTKDTYEDGQVSFRRHQRERFWGSKDTCEDGQGGRDKESSEFRFLWRLIRRYRSDTSYTFELNPLYFYEAEKGKGSYLAILGGLFGLETGADQHTRMRWLWLFGQK